MAAAQHFTTYFIPAAQRDAANVALALYFGDNPAVAQNFSVAAVPAAGPDDAPATWYYGGRPVADDTALTNFMALGTTLPDPGPGGWPVTGVGSVQITQGQAAAAMALMQPFTATKMDGTAPNPQNALASGQAGLSVKPQVIGGGGL